MHENKQESQAFLPNPELHQNDRISKLKKLLGRFTTKRSVDTPPTPESKPEIVKPSFTPDTIVHELQPQGGRGLDTYESHLLFDRHDLEGKRVLDLGAGPEVKFEKELHESGVNADVTSFSPDFAQKQHVETAKTSYPDAHLVAGMGEALPFADESFDRIVSLAVHIHVHDLKAYIKEITRVLADNGIARIGPDHVGAGPWETTGYDAIVKDDQLMTYLTEKGVQVQRSPIPSEVFKARVHDPFSNNTMAVGGSVIVLSKTHEN